MNINLRPGTFSGLIAHLAGWVRGSIIRGGAAVWEVHAAQVAGQVLVGDGTDIRSVAIDGDATLIGVLDTRYLRLDASNDPVTAGLEVNAATTTEPVLILQTTDDNVANPILEIQASGGGMLSEIEALGNLNFATATAANPGIIEINDTRFCHNYGTSNLFIGLSAGNFTLTGTENIGIGANTLDALTTGSENVAVGEEAGTALTTGYGNVCLGQEAGKALTTAFDNMLIGKESGLNITTGDSNVAIGRNTLWLNITGRANFALGSYSLNKCTADYNVAIGDRAMMETTTGEKSIGIGRGALNNNQTGSRSVGIGHAAGQGAAGNSHEQNVFIGYYSAQRITTGSYNVCVGYKTAEFMTTGARNIIIGYQVAPTGVAVSNELNIGALLYGDLSANTAGVNVTPPNLLATWHVDQPTDDAAIPVPLLDQADVSEEMIEFVSTIGVGNAIEAVGAKVLTVTHFIKVTLPGPLTRYIPVGTIA